MHFDLKTKSLAMIDLEVTLLIHLRFFQRTFHPPPFLAAKGPYCGWNVPFHGTHCAMGPGGVLKLSQRVRAEPGRQTFLVILRSENEAWEAPNISQQVRAEPGRQTCILTCRRNLSR